MNNPRYSNGALRRKYREMFKARGDACGICKGKLGPIHYDEPSNAKYPLSFVIDEINPVLQAAHWCCNAQKSDKTDFSLCFVQRLRPVSDGDW